jgi:pyruvate dehydrogenase E2 component (dihydrolipoamide acetyltransferase)
VEVRVPDLGDFADVEIIEVHVGPGDTVAKEDPLLTLETEKATMDVPAPAAGKVRALKVKVGGKVSAGDSILELDVAEAGPAGSPVGAALAATPAGPSVGAALAATPPAGRTAPGEEPTVRHPSPSGRVPAEEPTVLQPRPGVGAASAATAAGVGALAARPTARSSAPAPPLPPIDEASFARAHASPSVRKLARELGVDLGSVRGSGQKSRITADDVKAHVKEILRGGGSGPALPQVPQVDFAKFGPIEAQPLSRIQKISGPRLHASWVNIPHVTQHDEADITRLEETRAKLKDKAAERGIRLTPLAFVMRACVLALDEFPAFKASLGADGESLVMKRYTHLGFAADTPNGLVVPVIRDVDRKDVYAIAEELADLSQRARDGKLKADDIQGGVFTISSLGGIGGSYFTPIINAPEVAILGVSRSYWKPVWQGKEFAPRLMLPLSLSYDHRVIDGASAVRFVVRLAAILAEPDGLLEART